MYVYIQIGGLLMVRIISISDEVYADLSRMKDGKSFTELLKTLILECANKGDPKTILSYLKTNPPLSEEDAKSLTEASEKARKNATARKFTSLK
jgi:predicted CopG family antitoxin